MRDEVMLWVPICYDGRGGKQYAGWSLKEQRNKSGQGYGEDAHLRVVSPVLSILLVRRLVCNTTQYEYLLAYKGSL